MSFAGFQQFDKNLRGMMKTDKFKNSNDVEKLGLGYTLLNSKYGIGNLLGIVSKLFQQKRRVS